MARRGTTAGAVGGVVVFVLAAAQAAGQGGCTTDGTVLSPTEAGAADTGGSDARDGSAVCSQDAGTGAVGVVGCKCSRPGELACNGNAQKLPIVCLDGVWTAGAPCIIGSNCVSTPGPNQGVCAPIDVACAAAQPGEQVCSNANTIVTCGPDLVYQTAVHTCTGNTPTCSKGVCTCPATTCGMSCVDTKTDPSNCGACGNVCDGGGCSGGKCSSPTAFASGQMGPTAVTADSISVYFADSTSGSIVEAPLAGGAPTTLVSGITGTFGGIDVDATNVYWTNEGTNTCTGGDSGCTYNQDGSVAQVPIAGGSAVTLATMQDFPVGITVSSSVVYWVDANGGTVMAAPAGGGSVATLVAGQASPWAIASSAVTQSIYWLDRGTVQNEHHDGALVRMTPGPGALPDAGLLTVLAAGLLDPTSIALDATTIYWTSLGTQVNGYKDGAILKLPIIGGASSFLSLAQRGPSSIALDAKNAYWTDSASGLVASMPLGGGSEVVLAIGQSLPSAMPDGIAVQSSKVFWVNQAAGAIMTVPTP